MITRIDCTTAKMFYCLSLMLVIHLCSPTISCRPLQNTPEFVPGIDLVEDLAIVLVSVNHHAQHNSFSVGTINETIQLSEMKTFIHALTERKPLVLVGHSYGALLAVAYTLQVFIIVICNPICCIESWRCESFNFA